MKRILMVTMLLLLGISSAFAQGRKEQDARNAGRSVGIITPERAEAEEGRKNDWLFRSRPVVIPFLPSDVANVRPDGHNARPRPYNCSDEGVVSGLEVGRASGNCEVLSSPKTGTTWRMRTSKGGRVDRIFQVYPDGRARLHVVLDDTTIVSMSDEAARMATTKGYRLDRRNDTMVAINGQSEPSTEVAVGRHQRTQQVAQQPLDCSQVDGFAAKAKCFTESATRLGVLKP